MRQDEVVVDVKQPQLMLQAILALAQRVDPAADCGHALANVQIEPLYNSPFAVQKVQKLNFRGA